MQQAPVRARPSKGRASRCDSAESTGALHRICQMKIAAMTQRVGCRHACRGTDATGEIVSSIGNAQQFDLRFDHLANECFFVDLLVS